MADGAKSLDMPVADDFKTSKPRTAELWLALDYSKPGDRLTVSVGDTVLEPAGVDVASSWQEVGYRIAPLPGNGMIGFPSDKPFDMHFKALKFPVPMAALKTGRNPVSIRLNYRGPGSDKPLRIRRVELVTRMSETRTISRAAV